MAFKAPKSITAPKMAEMKVYPSKDSKLNGGLDLADTEFQLPDDKTNDCLNVWYINGELDKRWGQDYLLETETVEAVAHSSYKYLYKDMIVKHCGTKLYTQDPSTGINTEIFTGLNDAESRIFKYNENLYLKQVGNYVQWDGTTASDVEPYIPTVILNRDPLGAGGDLNEGYNRLGAGFINSFDGDGTTVYHLTDTDLDATLLTAVVDGVDKVETTDFTVNRTTGVVTFNVAPGTGTNNVEITAYKTDQEGIDSILNCLAVKPFGGQNDNRLFFGNNGTGFYYWTGISELGVDPTYFEYDNYNIVGLEDENITGFGGQQNSLIVIKEREVYGVDYTFDGTEGVFNSYPISDVFGCDSPDTIRTVNNNTVFLSSEFGVCVIQSTSVGNQRNVFSISRNIDPKLLAEDNLTQASALEYDGKYWLVVNDKAYVWDYYIAPYYDTGNPDDNAKRLSWWYFDAINAKSFIVEGDELYYINNDSGKTIKFHTTYDIEQYYDFGTGYNARYRYPYRLLGGGLYEFSVLYGNIGVRAEASTTFDVTYYTSDELTGEDEIEPIDVGSFTWNKFSWDLFTWSVIGPLVSWPLRPTLKNIEYFAVEFSNATAGTSMNIQSMKWTYRLGKRIK